MPQVRAVPEGMHSVTPHLICAGADAAIDFYKKAFAAEELCRMPGPQGRLMHGIVEDWSKMLDLTSEDYLWGVLKGVYPPVCLHEFDSSEMGVSISVTTH